MKWKPVDPNYYPNPNHITNFQDTNGDLKLPKTNSNVWWKDRVKLRELGQEMKPYISYRCESKSDHANCHPKPECTCWCHNV